MADTDSEYPDCSLLGAEWSLDEHDVDPSIFDDPFLEEVVAQIATETPEPPPKRFKSLNTAELQEVADGRFSKSTKSNSKWGFNVFSEWCKEKETEVNLATVTEEDLAEKLGRFYAEAKPKNSETEYHRNTMKNLRAALSRYIQIECGRDINIVAGDAFKRANEMLNGKLKKDCREGLSKPTAHKPIIPAEDMSAINNYLNKPGPIQLRYKVWTQLSIQYVTRGLEFHGQLSPNSVKFLRDETDLEYVTLTHVTQQKNHQGGLLSREENADKRMYATGDRDCPVASMKLYISKLHPHAPSLFSHIKKEALTDPEHQEIWYTTKPVGKRQFSNFMPDISKNSGLNRRYTAHSLRATALNAMTDQNIPSRHIMTLSDHSSESSLVPYTRPSTTHKKQMSRVLSNVFSENTSETSAPSAQIQSVSNQNDPQLVPSNPTMNNVSSMMNGFITNSSCAFHGCNFTFSK